MKQVGHEGDLRDGQPEVPGEEVVDDPPVPPAAGEGDPHQAETPASLAESVERSGLYHVPDIFAVNMQISVCPVNQKHSKRNRIEPDQAVELLVNDDRLVLGEVEDVAGHDAHDVALTPPAPGGEVVVRQEIVSLPGFVGLVVGYVPAQSVASSQDIGPEPSM